MRIQFISLIIIALFIFQSCKEDKQKDFLLPNEIKAGETAGPGIYYFDYTPDQKMDSIDLNNDGIFDLKFEFYTSSPHMLGLSQSSVYLITLGQNQVCVSKHQELNPNWIFQLAQNEWVDALGFSEIINDSMNWSNGKLLLDFRARSLGDINDVKYGFWSDVVNPGEKYIGIKIITANKKYFGWIGFYNCSVISDFGITKEFEK
jgi:hypothetical protein